MGPEKDGGINAVRPSSFSISFHVPLLVSLLGVSDSGQDLEVYACRIFLLCRVCTLLSSCPTKTSVSILTSCVF